MVLHFCTEPPEKFSFISNIHWFDNQKIKSTNFTDHKIVFIIEKAEQKSPIKRIFQLGKQIY